MVGCRFSFWDQTDKWSNTSGWCKVQLKSSGSSQLIAALSWVTNLWLELQLPVTSHLIQLSSVIYVPILDTNICSSCFGQIHLSALKPDQCLSPPGLGSWNRSPRPSLALLTALILGHGSCDSAGTLALESVGMSDTRVFPLWMQIQDSHVAHRHVWLFLCKRVFVLNCVPSVQQESGSGWRLMFPAWLQSGYRSIIGYRW